LAAHGCADAATASLRGIKSAVLLEKNLAFGTVF
jgi:hypothetical protein